MGIHFKEMKDRGFRYSGVCVFVKIVQR